MDTYENNPVPSPSNIQHSSEGSPAPTRDAAYLLRLYVGKNADVFERVRAGIQEATVASTASVSVGMKPKMRFHMFKWNWCASFLGPVWFFYRKLYLEGAALILLPIILAYLDIGKLQVGISGFLGVMANQYYVHRAQKRIAKIEQQALPVERRDELIRSRGGVSIAGLIFGLTLIALLVGAIIVSVGKTISEKKTAALPLCDAPAVRETVDGIVLGQLRENNIPTKGVSSGEYRETSSTSDARTCAMTLIAPGEKAPMNVKLTWRDETRKSFQAELSRAY